MKARSLLLSLLWVVLFSLGMAACKKTKPSVDQTVTITSFTPTQGEEGTIVTLTGKNFDVDKAKNVVRFNGVAAEVVEVKSATEMTVKVPADATSGKVSVVVNNQTATSTTDFAIVPTVKLTSFSPQEEMEGVIITLSGKNFDPVKTNNTVTFNGVAAEVTDATTTELKVRVPKATTGKIAVTVGNATATAADNFTVTAATFSATKLNEFIPCRVKFANSVAGTSYKWRDETKAVDLSIEKEPQITFMDEGTHTISLTMTRADGKEIKKNLSVTIVKDERLVAYYPLADRFDSSGNNKHGAANGIGYTGTGIRGRPNSAVSFLDPIGLGIFAMPDGLIRNTASFGATTVSLWFKPTVVSGKVKAGVLLSYQNEAATATAPGQFTPIIYLGEDERLYTGFWVNGGPKQIVVSATGYSKTGWNHVVLTADAQGEALYLNGVLIKNEPTFIPNHLSMIYNHLGKGNVAGWPGMSITGEAHFDGYIDEMRIYSKKIDAAGATALYQDNW